MSYKDRVIYRISVIVLCTSLITRAENCIVLICKRCKEWWTISNENRFWGMLLIYYVMKIILIYTKIVYDIFSLTKHDSTCIIFSGLRQWQIRTLSNFIDLPNYLQIFVFLIIYGQIFQTANKKKNRFLIFLY